jgi:hypothetical protein
LGLAANEVEKAMSHREEGRLGHVKFFCDLDPVERYDRFHRPLDRALVEARLGEVTGGGTAEDIETGRVLYSDMHVWLTGDIELALSVIRMALVEAGAPPDTEIEVAGLDGTFRLALH